MSKSNKRTKKANANISKQITKISASTDGEKVVWCFSRIDRGGQFAFHPDNQYLDSRFILEKIIEYSSMTWREVMNQTHDNGKSKHHFLNNPDGFSREAVDRICKLRLESEMDAIFSFALTNKIRIIGLRDGERFFPVWYDNDHSFYLSKKKHT